MRLNLWLGYVNDVIKMYSTFYFEAFVVIYQVISKAASNIRDINKKKEKVKFVEYEISILRLNHNDVA